MADRVNESAALVVAPMGEEEEGLVKNATLSSIFGPALAMLDEATIDTI